VPVKRSSKKAKRNNLLLHILYGKLHVPQIQVLYREEYRFLIFLRKKFPKQFVLFTPVKSKLRVKLSTAFNSTKGVTTEKIVPDPSLFLWCAQGNEEQHGSMRNSGWTYTKLFIKRVVIDWHRLPRDAAVTPRSKLFKTLLTKALSNLTRL